MLRLYCSLRKHIASYNVVVQSNIKCLCTLQCVILFRSMFQYITMYYSIFKTVKMYYSLLQHSKEYNIILQSNIMCLCILQRVIVFYGMFQYIIMPFSILHSMNVLQFRKEYCSTLQCVTDVDSVLQFTKA